MGQVYADKSVDKDFGRHVTKPVPGIPFPDSVPEGFVYCGHGHQDTHCASGLSKNTRKHPQGFSSRVLTIDLQKLLSLGTLPGKHNVMLLCGPEISNNQVIEIIPGSKKENIDNYKNQIEQLNNESMPLPFKNAYTELKNKAS